ncbi:hypothetical protein ACJMK2_039977 [Sinanodonta woodiana]|uniref:Uncharacterized protein n=1 Tax=Sinanodonta woodiana TaxID=1069815 RepID=A0ABD3WF42_SINWO
MSKLRAVLLMVTVTTTLLTAVNGWCFNEPLTIEKKGKWVIKKCVHDAFEYLIGSDFKTIDCFECSCTESGLFCCGFGEMAGAVDVPDGYKMVVDGCEYTIVKDDGAAIDK